MWSTLIFILICVMIAVSVGYLIFHDRSISGWSKGDFAAVMALIIAPFIAVPTFFPNSLPSTPPGPGVNVTEVIDSMNGVPAIDEPTPNIETDADESDNHESNVTSVMVAEEDASVDRVEIEYDFSKIAITEVMPNPCGAVDDDFLSDNKDTVWNEYIELYNFGDLDVDVRGLWITDGENLSGNPDMIVSWFERNPDVSLGNQLITNSTIIPPRGFAVILPAVYHLAPSQFSQPYIFPSDTIILTIAQGTYLGSDNSGLAVSQDLNTVTLYVGTEGAIENIISTYGTPRRSGSPSNIINDKDDGIPYFLRNCRSAERIDPSGPDERDNWTINESRSGSPGTGSYLR